MYGVVLMAALTAGQSAPEFHKYSCHGCGGCFGGMTHIHSIGGYNANCYGGFGTCFGCHGCYGCHGCLGQHAGYGANYGGCYGVGYAGWQSDHAPAGCWGMPYNGYGPATPPGYACYGGCGGYASPAFGVPGPVIATPAPAQEQLKAEPKETKPDNGDSKAEPKSISPKKADPDDSLSRNDNRARLIVKLPANARLYVDNTAIPNAARAEAFRTPVLARGQQYFYDLRAEVVRDGKVVTESRRVVLSVGDTIRADFSKLGDTTGVAAAGR